MGAAEIQHAPSTTITVAPVGRVEATLPLQHNRRPHTPTAETPTTHQPERDHLAATHHHAPPGTAGPTLSECLFFSIDPLHFVDGSTNSAGYSVIGENPGLFTFWSLSRSFQIITSIPESKSTLATFQLTPSRLFVHPENTMNFTLFGTADDDGLSTLFNYSPSNLFQKHQASNSPLQTRFPSRQFEAVEGKIFDTRQRIFVPEVYRRLQYYSEFYLDVEGTDI